jgi:KaiC/GvpD/RAD55 family RecA-like ATPase
MPRIALIEDFTVGPLPAGSNLLVEYDPDSQWYNAHATIAARWLSTGGRVLYHIAAQPREKLRMQLKRLGQENIEALETPSQKPTLALHDWYTASLSPKVPEDDEYVLSSLKVSELSIDWSKGEKNAEESKLLSSSGPAVLRLVDNVSCLARFNEEKLWVEFVLSRLIPRASKWNQISIIGLIKGAHSDWVYKTLESAVDGIIDFKLEETPDEPRDLMRIRTMRNVGFDRKWHKLKIAANSEVTVEKGN